MKPLDYSLFSAHMNDPSTLSVLLKGHLWVEHVVTQAVEVSLADSTQLSVERMSFASKLDLALAAGALPPELGPPLKRINRLRNNAAHDLGFTLTEEMMRGLVDSLSSSQLKNMWRAIHQNGHGLALQLSHWVHAVVYAVAWQNMVTDYERTYKRELEVYRLIKALGERLGDPVSDEELRATYGVPAPPDPRAVWSDYKAKSSAFASVADELSSD